MIRLFLVRHGITTWNEGGMYQGRVDVPLSDEGRDQVRRLRDRLRTEDFQASYCSELDRARESAVILLNGRSCPLYTSSDLNEVSYGLWEGLTRQEVRAQFPEEWESFLADRENQTPLGGESAADLDRRVRDFANSLARHQSEDDASILVAGHGGSLRTLVAQYLEMSNRDARKLRLDNASLSIVEVYEDDAVLSLFNDTSHLSPLKPPLDRQPVH